MESALPRSAIRRLAPVVGYAVAGACLVWLFHDVDWPQLLRDMGRIRWEWIAAAIVFDIGGYVFQGWRWALLLRPAGDISPVRTTQAIYAGLFTNEILPMRVGEIVRAFLVSRWLSTGLPAIVPSMLIERFFDALWLAVSIGAVAIFVELPRDLLAAADTLGAVVLAGTAILAFLVFRNRSGQGGPPREIRFAPLRVAGALIGRVEDGIKEIGRSRTLYFSFAVSFLVLLCQVLAYWLVMVGYGLRLSFWAGAAVLLIVRLGTVIPNAPANVGTYQFFTVVGLALFAVDKTTAAGFSVIVFLVLTIPLWAIGSVALTRSGMTLAGVRREIRQFGPKTAG